MRNKKKTELFSNRYFFVFLLLLVFSMGLSVEAVEPANDPSLMNSATVEGAYSPKYIFRLKTLKESLQKKKQTQESEVEKKENALPSPDSMVWDPVRNMILPVQLRSEENMGWTTPPNVDANEIFFDHNLDITNQLEPTLLSQLGVSLGAGDLDTALSLLREQYGNDVEIVRV